MRYRDNYGNALAEGNRIDRDGAQVRPDGGVVQPGPATYRREGSSGSVTTMSGNPYQDSYAALFANARTPADQQAIRSQYAQSLLAPVRGQEDSDRADAALRRRMEEGRFGLERDRFGLESELSRGRLGMQGSLANALAQAMGNRGSFFGGGNDMPPWMQGGDMEQSQEMGLNLREPTRNYLMRFLKG